MTLVVVTTINKRRIRVYTKLRVEPQYWNHEIYRCYQNGGLNIRERLRLKYINEQIDNLVTSLCEMDEQLAMKGEYLSAAVVRQIVDKNQQKEQLLQNPIACLRRLVGDYEKNVNRKGKHPLPHALGHSLSLPKKASGSPSLADKSVHSNQQAV